MASKKDQRREDLIIPYQEPATKKDSDMGSTMSTTMPMAAMFTRNKYIGWASVVFAMQTWLSESPQQAKSSSQPAIFGVGMSFMALVVTYLPYFLPPVPLQPRGTGTGPAAAAPAA